MRSIMSGDSPNSHQNDIFDFKDGRASPTPTTSKEVGIQSGEVIHASVLVEPDKERDEKNLSTPMLNSSCNEESRDSDPDQTVQLDELSYTNKGKNDKDGQETKKLNGDFDKLDGVWVPGKDNVKSKPADEDEDNCTVKCLYYTMQCCECVIV